MVFGVEVGVDGSEGSLPLEAGVALELFAESEGMGVCGAEPDAPTDACSGISAAVR